MKINMDTVAGCNFVKTKPTIMRGGWESFNFNVNGRYNIEDEGRMRDSGLRGTNEKTKFHELWEERPRSNANRTRMSRGAILTESFDGQENRYE